MKLKLFSLTAAMESLGVPLEERPEVLAMSLARSLGYKLPLPSTPLTSPERFYQETYRSDVDTTLAQINERVVFNLAEVSNCIAAIWLFRYRMVHDPMNVAVRDFTDVMAKVGGDKFPAKVSEFLIRQEDTRVVDKLAAAIDQSVVAPSEPTEAEITAANTAVEEQIAEQSAASEEVAEETTDTDVSVNTPIVNEDGFEEEEHIDSIRDRG